MAVTTPAGILLTSADDWARDVLLDVHNNTHSAGGLLAGWADVMRAAAAAWRAVPSHTTTGAPFESAALTAAQIVNDSPGRPETPDSRTQRIVGLLDSLVDAIPARAAAPNTVPLDDAGLRTGILQVGYVLTHAAATSTARQAVATGGGGLVRQAHQRIRGIEQLLDAHLHGEHRSTPATDAAAEVEQSLNSWLRVAFEAGQPPNPMTQLILADTARTVLGNSARLAIHAVQQHQLDTWDVQERLLPAIRQSAERWEDSRSLWAAMISPTSRQLPAVVTAATRLQQALRQPDLTGNPVSRSTIMSALVATSEVALINHRALTHPELTAPLSTVTRLTSEVLDREPSGHSAFKTWMNIGRREGSMPAKLPDIVRTDLATRGRSTLEAALAARSAGHILTQPRTLSPDAMLHTARVAASTPRSRPQTPLPRTTLRSPSISP